MIGKFEFTAAQLRTLGEWDAFFQTDIWERVKEYEEPLSFIGVMRYCITKGV